MYYCADSCKSCLAADLDTMKHLYVTASKLRDFVLR